MLTRVDELGGRRHQRRASGTRSSCPASSWRTSAGSGTSCDAMTRPRRQRRAAAARAVRPDARRAQLPGGPADAAPDRVLAVRHALHAEFDAGRRALGVQALLDEVRTRGRRADAARVQPLPEQLLAHLRRRLRGRLLQLQVGRGAVGRRLRRLRGGRRRRPTPQPGSPRPAGASSTRSSRSAAAGRRSTRSARSAAASRSIDALLRHSGMVEAASG